MFYLFHSLYTHDNSKHLVINNFLNYVDSVRTDRAVNIEQKKHSERTISEDDLRKMLALGGSDYLWIVECYPWKLTPALLVSALPPAEKPVPFKALLSVKITI